MLVATPVLLLVTEGLPSPEGTWNFLTALALFVMGFVIASSECLQEVIRRTWRWLLAGGVVTMAVAYAVWLSGTDERWVEGSVQDVAFQLVESSNTWLWVLGLIGAAGAFLAGPATRRLRSTNEGAYPWYSLHQTVIVTVAFFVVRWDVGVLPKFTCILVASFGLTLLLYEIVVRRWNGVRFLFGLKPQHVEPSVPRVAARCG